MRLIDADALNELLEHHERTLLYNVKHGNSNKSRDFIMGVEDGYYRVQSDIKWIPTVDAVKVVRCKDCLYWQQNTVRQNSNDAGWWNEALCERHTIYGNEPHEAWTDADWYCADGERGEG